MIPKDPTLHNNHDGDFIQQELNEHDRQSIEKAKNYGYTQWGEVSELARYAETVEGYLWLNSRAIKLWHDDEASCGMI